MDVTTPLRVRLVLIVPTCWPRRQWRVKWGQGCTSECVAAETAHGKRQQPLVCRAASSVRERRSLSRRKQCGGLCCVTRTYILQRPTRKAVRPGQPAAHIPSASAAVMEATSADAEKGARRFKKATSPCVVGKSGAACLRAQGAMHSWPRASVGSYSGGTCATAVVPRAYEDRWWRTGGP